MYLLCAVVLGQGLANCGPTHLCLCGLQARNGFHIFKKMIGEKE